MATRLPDAQVLAQYPIPSSLAGLTISNVDWVSLLQTFARQGQRTFDYPQAFITAERHVASSPDIYPAK